MISICFNWANLCILAKIHSYLQGLITISLKAINSTLTIQEIPRPTVYRIVVQTLRDCSLFMPKEGSVIFKQFRHMKNLPLPGSGYFKITPPPVYVIGPKCNPPTPTPLPSGRDVPPIAKLRTTRVLAGCR